MLIVTSRHLVKGGSCPACWRSADVVSMPKKSSSSVVRDYRLISITFLLSKVFEKIMAEKSSHFLESNSLLRSPYRKTWEYVILCSHCLTLYKLLWTGAWREGLFSWSC